MLKIKKLFFFIIILLTVNYSLVFSKTNQLDYEIILTVNSPYLTINNVVKEIDPGRNTSPVLIKEWGRVVLPIRVIIESLGGEIYWYQDERKVSITLDGNNINLWINNSVANVNGSDKFIDETNPNVKPIIINDRTMLPIRFVAENLGCSVDWIQNEKKVVINYSKKFIADYKNEISLSLKEEEKGEIKLKLRNPLNEDIKLNLALYSINKPINWLSEFCIKDICFFEKGEISLKSNEEKDVEIYIYTKGKGVGEFIFCVSYEDHKECINIKINGG